MACFIVPATEAIVTTVVAKVVNKKISSDATSKEVTENISAHFAKNLDKLNYLLWGGSGMLAFEHLWHGEIQPFFPFLTAVSNPEDTVNMLRELSTVGVSMALIVTSAWAIITYASYKLKYIKYDQSVIDTKENA